jgi:hypothetical protein
MKSYCDVIQIAELEYVPHSYPSFVPFRESSGMTNVLLTLIPPKSKRYSQFFQPFCLSERSIWREEYRYETYDVFVRVFAVNDYRSIACARSL